MTATIKPGPIIFSLNRTTPMEVTPLIMFEGVKIYQQDGALCYIYKIILPEIIAN